MDVGMHWMTWEVYEALYGATHDELGRNYIAGVISAIGDATVDDERRSELVLDLFRYKVRPGWNSEDLSALFKGTNWLQEADIHPILALGGSVDVDLDNDEIQLAVTVIPFAKNRGRDPATITFGIRGIDPSMGNVVENVTRFLSGKMDGSDAYIVEFVLRFGSTSDQLIERFTQRGHGIWGNWRSSGIYSN